MSLPQDGAPHKRPKGALGLFRISCAACGKGNLRTRSGKHTSANAGFCRSCGVFVGFECARKAGWRNWKRMCPSCSGRLRANTLLTYGMLYGLVFMIASITLFPLGMDMIRLDNVERTRAEMALSDPGLLVAGRTVKLEGTISGTHDTPLCGSYIGTGRSSYWQWEAHDFDLICANGTVKVRASLLDGTRSSTGVIMGSDGYHGAYRNGSAIDVIGVVAEGQPQPSVEPRYVAPNAEAFYTGHNSVGWWMVGLGLSPVPLFFIAFPALIGRYRSHWRRLSDFHTDAKARPLGSVAEVHASEAKLDHPKTGGVIKSPGSGLTVEELTRQMKPE